ncbi:MAG: two-component response regulator [Methanoregulaceae archaeon PtaU1.Bin059]|nr:MAG: two-component response regulator [Methanoregulaceae archaeon PtaB.Bin152]OPY38628.1 MAG: two-component response regulator [Methanoregulaceae archaeon PtaU1.Bin059]
MKSTRILVVEDEQIVAEDLKMTLESLGYRVAGIASSGEKAIELAGTEKPDLILMDIMLAGKMDGITAASEIRGSHDIPIIYVTAYADSNLLERAKMTAPYGYIVKPFNEREVQSNIEIALFKHHMEHEIKKRDAILLALGFGVEWFLRQFSDTHRITLRGVAGTWGYDFLPILEQIAIAMDLDRVQVLQFRGTGRPFELLDLITEWTMGATPYHLKGNESPVIALSDIGLSGSMRELLEGTPVMLHPEKTPGNECPLLEHLKVHSAIVFPIYVQDRIWGLALFATGKAREFLGEEVEAMKISVNIIGGAISLYVSAEAQSPSGPAVR